MPTTIFTIHESQHSYTTTDADTAEAYAKNGLIVTAEMVPDECANDYHEPEQSPHMPDQDQRYRGFEVGDDEIVIHDKKHKEAWVQSDYWIDFSRS